MEEADDLTLLKQQKTRTIIQSLALISSLVLLYFLITHQLKYAHKFCPYAVVCFGSMAIRPGFNRIIFPLTVLFGSFIAVSTIFSGRAFCGYLCPLGTMQKLLYSLNPEKKSPIKHSFHKKLQVIKYLVLALTFVAAIFAVQYVYMGLCPVMYLANPQAIGVTGIIGLVSIFGTGIFVERFWCRYLCPYAALMNIFQALGRVLHIPHFRITIDPDKCGECFECSEKCPMGIQIEEPGPVEDLNCIHCKKCLEMCVLKHPIDRILYKKEKE